MGLCESKKEVTGHPTNNPEKPEDDTKKRILRSEAEKLKIQEVLRILDSGQSSS